MKEKAENKTSRPIPPGLFQIAASLDDAISPQTLKSNVLRHRKGVSSDGTPISKAQTARGRDITFRLKAPSAKSVQVAADFTGWEKSPVKLAKGKDGTWEAAVSLLAGRYTYRFIVDGQWCNDPGCAETVPNQFGTVNAVVRVP